MPTSKKQSAGKTSEHEALAKELKALMPQLDEEGLSFLIEQARVHIYNMKVTELEEAARAAEESSARRSKGRADSGTSAASDSGGSGRGSKAAPVLSIEADEGGTSFHIVCSGKWKLFSGDEMLALVRIASAAASPAEAGPRLYRWLKEERSDVFTDLPIRGAADPLLAELAGLLTKTFAIRKPARR